MKIFDKPNKLYAKFKEIGECRNKLESLLSNYKLSHIPEIRAASRALEKVDNQLVKIDARLTGKKLFLTSELDRTEWLLSNCLSSLVDAWETAEKVSSLRSSEHQDAQAELDKAVTRLEAWRECA